MTVEQLPHDVTVGTSRLFVHIGTDLLDGIIDLRQLGVECLHAAAVAVGLEHVISAFQIAVKTAELQFIYRPVCALDLFHVFFYAERTRRRAVRTAHVPCTVEFRIVDPVDLFECTVDVA